MATVVHRAALAARPRRALRHRAPSDRRLSVHSIVDELNRDREVERRATLDRSASMDPMIAAFPPPDDLYIARRVEALRSQLERAWAHKTRGALAAALRIFDDAHRPPRAACGASGKAGAPTR